MPVYCVCVYTWHLVTFVATRLELMFERAEQWSSELEKNHELLDCWKRRGDELLYSMIPRSVADRLRTEQNSLNTCQVRVQGILEGCHLLRVFYKFSGSASTQTLTDIKSINEKLTFPVTSVFICSLSTRCLSCSANWWISVLQQYRTPWMSSWVWTQFSLASMPLWTATMCTRYGNYLIRQWLLKCGL